jgi:hypothetical protein
MNTRTRAGFAVETEGFPRLIVERDGEAEVIVGP